MVNDMEFDDAFIHSFLDDAYSDAAEMLDVCNLYSWIGWLCVY